MYHSQLTAKLTKYVDGCLGIPPPHIIFSKVNDCIINTLHSTANHHPSNDVTMAVSASVIVIKSCVFNKYTSRSSNY